MRAARLLSMTSFSRQRPRPERGRGFAFPACDDVLPLHPTRARGGGFDLRGVDPRGFEGGPRGGRAATELGISRRLPLGNGHIGLPDRGRHAGGRPGRFHLGHVLPAARQDPRRRQCRRRRRSLSPLQGGRGADEGAGRVDLPLLDRLAAPVPGGARGAQRQGPGLLRPAGRRTAGQRHHALRHALSLGPASGPAGSRRLGIARDGGGLRRLCGLRRLEAQRPRRPLLHPERDPHLRRAGLRRRHDSPPVSSCPGRGSTRCATTPCSATALPSRRCARSAAAAPRWAWRKTSRPPCRRSRR